MKMIELIREICHINVLHNAEHNNTGSKNMLKFSRRNLFKASLKLANYVKVGMAKLSESFNGVINLKYFPLYNSLI